MHDNTMGAEQLSLFTTMGSFDSHRTSATSTVQHNTSGGIFKFFKDDVGAGDKGKGDQKLGGKGGGIIRVKKIKPMLQIKRVKTRIKKIEQAISVTFLEKLQQKLTDAGLKQEDISYLEELIATKIEKLNPSTGGAHFGDPMAKDKRTNEIDHEYEESFDKNVQRIELMIHNGTIGKYIDDLYNQPIWDEGFNRERELLGESLVTIVDKRDDNNYLGDSSRQALTKRESYNTSLEEFYNSIDDTIEANRKTTGGSIYELPSSKIFNFQNVSNILNLLLEKPSGSLLQYIDSLDKTSNRRKSLGHILQNVIDQSRDLCGENSIEYREACYAYKTRNNYNQMNNKITRPPSSKTTIPERKRINHNNKIKTHETYSIEYFQLEVGRKVYFIDKKTGQKKPKNKVFNKDKGILYIIHVIDDKKVEVLAMQKKEEVA